MWRKTSCAAFGLALAFAAAYGLTSTRSDAAGPLLDLSFLYPQHSTAKSDRMPVSSAAEPASAFALSFNLPQHNMTVVAKNPPMPPVVESAVRFPRSHGPVHSVTPQDRHEVVRKQKLPEGCEPPFSPVTVPAMAHVASRCMS